MKNDFNFKLEDTKYFIKIPKEVILANTIPEQRISAFTYLFFYKNIFNSVKYSPIDMIECSGYKAHWNRKQENNIFVKFLDCMKWFYENEYIKEFNESEFKLKWLQTSTLNLEKMNPEGNFAILHDFEINKILDYESSYKPLSKSVLLLLLAYIKAFTWERKSEKYGETEKTKKEKPRIFHSKYTTMSNFIGVSPRLISRATDVLVDLGFIETYKMPNFQDSEGKWYTDDTIFVQKYKIINKNDKLIVLSDAQYNYKKELEYGIQFLRESSYVSKKFYQD